jgi:hypothetical protein
MIQIFESLYIVCQKGIKHDSNMLFWSWEVWHILPTYEQILTITKFVSSECVAGMKLTFKPLLSVIRGVNT